MEGKTVVVELVLRVLKYGAAGSPTFLGLVVVLLAVCGTSLGGGL